jgi:hypothetical protein
MHASQWEQTESRSLPVPSLVSETFLRPFEAFFDFTDNAAYFSNVGFKKMLLKFFKNRAQIRPKLTDKHRRVALVEFDAIELALPIE